ncbi:hypothetical protein ARMGADRAFT_602882 [Armillaria gallica]|uniref:Secreted protein n=1 Tax=Armillaria gallica TaxID=47427 RepID=A0A2H3CNR9_ARMGA|nr:hypothetical protein ARMGADRAFT_602882 [Armillaria gallica]
MWLKNSLLIGLHTTLFSNAWEYLGDFSTVPPFGIRASTIYSFRRRPSTIHPAFVDQCHPISSRNWFRRDSTPGQCKLKTGCFFPFSSGYAPRRPCDSPDKPLPSRIPLLLSLKSQQLERISPPYNYRIIFNRL